MLQDVGPGHDFTIGRYDPREDKRVVARVGTTLNLLQVVQRIHIFAPDGAPELYPMGILRGSEAKRRLRDRLDEFCLR